MLSVVISTWNEEANLPRAVSSVKKIADEIVVVDTESTDKTVEVAKKLGCKVFHHKNTGIVEPVRNFSISKASGDWILLLDADEEVPQRLAKFITEAIKNTDIDYYRIPRRNVIFGKAISSSHWWPDYVYRLFKKDAVSWEDTIHSVPFTRGVGRDVPAEEDLALIHHHYSDISQYVSRLNRYTDHQLKHLLDTGYSFSWSDLISKPISEFIMQFFSRHGYRDGVHGLALAGLQAFSEFILYLKLWQSSDFVSTRINLDKLDQVVTGKAREYVWWKYQALIDDSGFFSKIILKIRRKLGL
jgi:(heptosyl)LPS beta-1,4-glucosyltransferase